MSSLFDCTTLSQAYQQGDCNDPADFISFAKIVGTGIITNPSKNFADPAVWAAYTDLASLELDMIVIPSIIGDYDGGVAQKTEGYGTKEEKIANRLHTANFDVEYLSKNWELFNKAQSAANYGTVLITGDLENVFYSGKRNITMDTTLPIGRDKKVELKYVTQMTWSNRDLIKPVVVPDNIRALFG